MTTFADVFIRCLALEDLEPSGEVVVCDEVEEMDLKLFATVIVLPFAVAYLIVWFMRSAWPFVYRV